MKSAFAFTAVLLTMALITGCSKKANESKDQTKQQVPNSVAGIHWMVPEHWSAQAKQSMRAATYSAPAPKEGVEPGDCGVFSFGGGQGGSIQANLSRWISQFENGGQHQFSSKEVNGLKLTTIQIQGTYLAPSGPTMEPQGKKPDYRLLGAIVEAPEGMVFFKLVGPSTTISANESDFDTLINSLQKDQVQSSPPLSSEK